MNRIVYHWIRRAAVGVEASLVLIYILFEELVWERFAKPVKRFIERWLTPRLTNMIRRMSPFFILILFLLLLGVTQGFGIGAGVAVVRGMVLLGVLLYVCKVIMAGVTFWILSVGREQLFQIGWFKQAYDLVMSIREWIVTRDIYLRTKERAQQVIVQIRKAADRWRKRRGRSRLKRIYTALKRRVVERVGNSEDAGR